MLRLSLLISLLALLVLPAAAAAQAEPDRPLVYVFVLDGLDGDRVDTGRAPYISSLLAGQEGASSTYYRESRSIMVAETNNNHVAMATGAYANKSGIPGNTYAVYERPASGTEENDEGCDAGPTDNSQAPTVTSGESPECLKAQTLFESIANQPNPAGVTTAGIFGKPKLGRIFSKRRANGTLVADYLAVPCESRERDNPDYCRRDIQDNPATGTAINDGEVMDEVLRTVREGVPADGTTKRPNLTFANFPAVDQTGHGTGAGAAYDEAIAMADGEIRRFVDQQKALGLWSRTVMVLLSDHSMDSTPEKTSLQQCFTLAGISPSAYTIVGNGSAALVYLNNRADPGRFALLARMRAASESCGPAPGIDRVVETLYREDNPMDGGAANTVRGRHPAWNLDGPRVGDLVITHATNGNFNDVLPTPLQSDSFNPLAGNHGGPQTRDNTFAVIGGGDFVRQQTVEGQRAELFDDTAQNPGQAENVDVAPTVLTLFGRAASSANQGRFLREAFNCSALPGGCAKVAATDRLRVTVSPRTVFTRRATRFRFKVTVAGPSLADRIRCSARRKSGACKAQTAGQPVKGALVRFAGLSGRTGPRGRVTLFARRGLRSVRTYRARATRSGFGPGTTSVRAVRAINFTG